MPRSAKRPKVTRMSEERKARLIEIGDDLDAINMTYRCGCCKTKFGFNYCFDSVNQKHIFSPYFCPYCGAMFVERSNG